MLNTENAMSNTTLTQLQEGLTTAYIDGTAAANLAYKLVQNKRDYSKAKRVFIYSNDLLTIFNERPRHYMI